MNALAISGLVIGGAVLIAFGTSVIHAMVGFAFGLLSTPVFLLLFPPKEVVVLTVLLMLVLNPLIFLPGWRAIQARELKRLVIPMAVGLPLGAFALTVVTPPTFRFLTGCTLVALATPLLLGWRPRTPYGPAVAGLAGFAGGVLTTSLNFNGPPVAWYLAGRSLDPHAFRVTIATYLFCAHVLGVAVFAATGLLTLRALTHALALAPACLAGYWLGARWRGRLDEDQFTRLVFRLLLLMGVLTAASAASLP